MPTTAGVRDYIVPVSTDTADVPRDFTGLATDVGVDVEELAGRVEVLEDDLRGRVVGHAREGTIDGTAGEVSSTTTDSTYRVSGAVSFVAGREYLIHFSGTLRSDASNPRSGLVKFQAGSVFIRSAQANPLTEFSSGWDTGSRSVLFRPSTTETLACGVRCTRRSSAGTVWLIEAEFTVIDCGPVTA